MSHGTITVVSGGMCCGKSDELIRRLERAIIGRQQVRVFKPVIDTRSDAAVIVSRSGRKIDALTVSDPLEILALVGGMRVVGIDEAQFFDETLVGVCEGVIARSAIRVIVAGLDTDFRGEPFEAMARLMAVADEVVKLSAVCIKCGQPARHSQRLIGGVPAPYDAPRIAVGGNELYEPRCRDCFRISRVKKS